MSRPFGLLWMGFCPQLVMKSCGSVGSATSNPGRSDVRASSMFLVERRLVTFTLLLVVLPLPSDLVLWSSFGVGRSLDQLDASKG